MTDIMVTNLNEIPQYLVENKKIGVWWVASLIHEGHLKCLEVLKSKADFIIGMYMSNFYQMVEYITGNNIGEDKPFSEITMDTMIGLVDILHVSAIDYLPYDKHTPTCQNEKELPTLALPDFIINDIRTLSLLRVAQSNIRKVHELTSYSFNVGSVKDPWRPYGAVWASKFLNIDYTLLEPERDKFGNSYSSSFMAWQQKTNQIIDFQILQPGMRRSLEVEHRLRKKGIEGLEVINFFYDTNTKYIFTKIKFDNIFWSECLKEN